MYLNAVPDDTTLIRWANLIQPKTLEKFNQRIVQLAVEQKVTRGRKLRTDVTLVVGARTLNPLTDLMKEAIWKIVTIQHKEIENER